MNTKNILVMSTLSLALSSFSTMALAQTEANPGTVPDKAKMQEDRKETKEAKTAVVNDRKKLKEDKKNQASPETVAADKQVLQTDKEKLKKAHASMKDNKMKKHGYRKHKNDKVETQPTEPKS